MPTGTEQATVVRDLSNQERYPEAYRYLASQLSGTTWDPRLLAFLERAAEINQPGNNFWKDFVYTSNALRAGDDPNLPSVIQHNQDVSDSVARAVLESIASALESGTVRSPAEIYEFDLIALQITVQLR